MKIYDLVGVGVGPANLALAAAIAEHGNIEARFLEFKSSFAWHPNMLLEDTELQISFLKDIVTMRNPQSPYTFVNYLFQRSRLADFINLKHFYPSRFEYNDYLSWVAQQLQGYIKYSAQVLSIEAHRHNTNKIFKIRYHDLLRDKIYIIYAKNVVIAVGGTMKVPEFMDLALLNEQVFHSEQYLQKIEPLFATVHDKRHFCVVGKGQSAAEIALDLYKRFPNAQITMLHRGFGIKSVDDSWFTNKIYDQQTLEMIYAMQPQERQNILKEYRETNYAALDLDLVEKLGHILYQQLISGQQRLRILNFSTLIGIEPNDSGVLIAIQNSTNSESKSFLHVDNVILCTGYNYNNPPTILAGLQQYIIKDADNKPITNKGYSLRLESGFQGKIFTQGCNEETHGLSDTLLSLSAIRAKSIFDQISDSSFNSLSAPEVLYAQI